MDGRRSDSVCTAASFAMSLKSSGNVRGHQTARYAVQTPASAGTEC